MTNFLLQHKNSNIMWSRLYLFVITLLMPFYLRAVPEPVYTNQLQGEAIHVGNGFDVRDDKFETHLWHSILATNSAENTLTFELNEELLSSVIGSQRLGNFTAWVEVIVDGKHADGSPFYEYKRLSLNYYADKAKQSEVKSIFKFRGIHYLKVNITNLYFRGDGEVFNGDYTGNLPPFFNLRSDIFIDRIMKFDCDSRISDFRYEPYDNQRLPIFWSPVEFADEYDLEWTFFDERSPLNGSSNEESIYKNNSTRVTLKGTTYFATLVYPIGKLFYRVRAVHYGLEGKREVTDWTYSNPFDTQGHQDDMNWQTQMVFAEEGKFTQNIKYYDASLRERQSSTLANASMTLDSAIVVVGQTIYDYQGRPALKVMPVPLAEPNLSYIPSLSKNRNNENYSREDFIVKNEIYRSDCAVNTNAMEAANTLGAANYYSPFNPKMGENNNAFIPNANGYPFSVTEYTPDATGRIARQGGVGNNYQLNSTHETKYFYGKPTQVELDRLFGVDVGYKDHYLKNVVQDPNGQLSIAYVDAHGRTIATALAGSKPDALDGLQSRPNAPTIITEKLTSNDENGVLHASHSYTVTSPGIHTIDYLLNKIEINDFCTPFICYTCAYDLELKISSDNCSEGVVFHGIWKNYTPSDIMCQAALSNPITWTRVNGNNTQPRNIDQRLNVGTYHIEKWLRVSKTHQESLLQEYLKSSCVLPIDSFINRELRKADYSNCVEADNVPTCNTCHNKSDCQETDCDILRAQLLADVSPNGQYGVTFNATTQSYDMNVLSVYDSWQFEEYLDCNGQQIRININGILLKPNDLTFNEFINRFEPQWAYAFLRKHPEHCYYQWCLNTAKSWFQFENAELTAEKIKTKLKPTITHYQNRVPRQPRDLEGWFKNDWNATNNTINANIPNNLTSLLETGSGFPQEEWTHLNNLPIPNTSINIIYLAELAAKNVFCETDNCDPWALLLNNNCVALEDKFYRRLRDLYVSSRRYLIYQRRDRVLGPHPNNNNTTCWNSSLDARNRGKQLRVLHISEVPRTFFEQNQQNVQGSINQHCAEVCKGNAKAWLALLNIPNTHPQYINLSTYFEAVCSKGCDVNHPMGATTTSNSNSVIVNGQTLRSVQDVWNYFMNNPNACNSNSTIYSINHPGTYNGQYKPLQITKIPVNSSICERISYLTNTANTTNETIILSLINSYNDIKLSIEEFRQLKNACSNNTPCGNFISDDYITIPPILENGKCKTCQELQTIVESFTCSNTSNIERNDLLIKYLNFKSDLNLTASEYYTFMAKCRMINSTFFRTVESFIMPYNNTISSVTPEGLLYLCPRTPMETTQDIELSDCRNFVQQEAIVVAYEKYRAYIDSVKNAFRIKYSSKCISKAAEVENFTFKAPIAIHHITLYYYDQAGNLVQTVPPQGITIRDEADFLQTVATNRLAEVDNPNYRPAHTLQTRYWFNSLNKVVKQQTPDADISFFWYDYLGRLVLSQNQKQFNERKFSYTIFDNLGRTTEVGEIRLSQALPYYTTGEENYYEQVDRVAKYQSFNVQLVNSSDKTQVTRTYYDAVPDFAVQIPNFEPTNLRNRVAMVTFSENGNINEYNYATRYTYDVAGNVPTLIHDIPELEGEGYIVTTNNPENPTIHKNHRFKRLDYAFDLLSGKVNSLAYQQGEPDAHYYRYRYDANNRLIESYTSTDNLTWERDANYDYYRHAPLSRVLLGHRNVQGIDYAYTLQGWIKGVNGGIEGQDIANDKNSEDVMLAAKDIYGYAINYHQGDFSAISSNLFAPENDENSATYNLYNGNIRSIINHIGNLGNIAYTYQYDQLNRISGMYSSDVERSDRWRTSYRNKYRESVTYDANGNIKSYLRYNQESTVLDNLTYNYDATRRNRLLSVSDAAGSSPTFKEDVEGNNHYEYDAIGNLTQMNENGSIQRLWWNVYGKVSRVEKGEVRMSFGYDAQQNRLKKMVEKSEKDQTNYYLRDAQGNVLTVYRKTKRRDIGKEFFLLEEQTLYGSSRLGVRRGNRSLRGVVTQDPMSNEVIAAFEQWGKDYWAKLSEKYDTDLGKVLYERWGDEWKYRLGILLGEVEDENWLVERVSQEVYVHEIGYKQYELSNHLGNVLAVVSDKKEQENGVWQAVVISAKDYYPFGMSMPSRTTEGGTYRYGFNGKETDQETGIQDYGMRWYLPNIARFPSVDPLTAQYPWYTPYQFAGNKPINSIDLDGLEEWNVIQSSTSVYGPYANQNAAENSAFQYNRGPKPMTIYLIYTTNVTVNMEKVKDNVQRIFTNNGIHTKVSVVSFDQAKKAKGLTWQWVDVMDLSIGRLYLSDENTYATCIIADRSYDSYGSTPPESNVLLEQNVNNKDFTTLTTAGYYVNESKLRWELMITREQGIDVDYRIGYYAAHEVLHKMLLRAEKMGFKVNYTSTTGNQAMHNNTKTNLNMDGAELSSRGLEPKKAPAKGLNEAEKILPNHKEAIIKMQIQNAKNEK